MDNNCLLDNYQPKPMCFSSIGVWNQWKLWIDKKRNFEPEYEDGKVISISAIGRTIKIAKALVAHQQLNAFAMTFITLQIWYNLFLIFQADLHRIPQWASESVYDSEL